MSAKAQGVNTAVLRQCREQMGLQSSDVEAIARIKSYAAYENGDKQLTYGQRDRLADLYEVDRWVFRREQLPDDYQFDKQTPAFEQFKKSSAKLFGDYKLRGVLARVAWMRGDIQELRVDWQEPVPRFKPPRLSGNASAIAAAGKVRNWLGATGKHDFSWWRKKLEQKGVFSFVTSKRRRKFYVSPAHFRGLAVYYDLLPIIIINGAGKRKSKSSTLFYELGHLLFKKHSIDGWQLRFNEDRWCEEFADHLLMPAKEIQDAASEYASINLNAVRKLAIKFNVSSESCLVRMRQIDAISRTAYSGLKRELERRRLEKPGRTRTGIKAAGKRKGGKKQTRVEGVPKKLSDEELVEKEKKLADKRTEQSLEQYGRLYANTLFNAWSDDEINLIALRKALDLASWEQAEDLHLKLV